MLAEKHRAAAKKPVLVFGEYNPRTKVFRIRDEAKLKLWLDRKVEMSPTAQNLLIKNNLLQGKKAKAWRPKVKEKPAAAPAAEAAPAA